MKALPLLLTCLLLAPAAAANDVKDGLLLFHEVAIDAREAALKDVERRAAIEIERLQAWLGFYESLRGSLGDMADALLTDKQTLIKRMSRSAQYVEKMARNPDDFVGTPEGSFSPRKIKETVRSLETAAAVLGRAINASDQLFYFLGWGRNGTGKQLERLIEDTRNKIDAVRRQKEDGTYRITYPIPGRHAPVDGQFMNKEIAYHRGEIEKTSRLIKEGEYGVRVPGFHQYVTRNAIEAMIQAEKDRIAAIVKQRNNKEYKIWTPFAGGPIHQQELEKRVKGLEGAVAATEAAFGDDSWKTYFPVFGLKALSTLKEWIKTHDERTKKIREQIASGDLPIHVPGVGTTTKNKVEKWLDSLAGKTDPKSRETRTELTAALPKIAAGGVVSIEHEEISRQRVDRILKLAPELVEPWKTRKDLEIAERNRVIQQGYRDEVANHVQEIERNIKKLERLRDIFIP